MKSQNSNSSDSTLSSEPTSENTIEKIITVGVGAKNESLEVLKDQLSELEGLVQAAGGEVVGSCLQRVKKFSAATLIGEGKIQEIKEMVQNTQAQGVVIDFSLSGVQGRNLQNELGVKVLDRNQLIIEIFARRAQTFEGKLQVELAQLLDQMPRMVDAWMGSLSRLGGGIGTRGPGEKAIEIDRRRIREKIDQIREKLEEVKKHRALHRASRKKNKIPSFALIGYTNSGKSTLLNQVTHADVETKNQVFSTLDPTTRKIFLSPDKPAVITDTVGFIRDLPPQLIEAFKATLEEAGEADVLLHVIDTSNPQMESQIQVVQNLIKEFSWDKKPIIHVFNKMDVAGIENKMQAQLQPKVFISGLTGEGVDRLKEMMLDTLFADHLKMEFFFPHEKEYLIYELDRESKILKKETATQGTLCVVMISQSHVKKWEKYLAK